MWLDVIGQAQDRRALHQFEGALILQHQARLVAQLVMPAARFSGIEGGVNELLHLLAGRRRADDAQRRLYLVEMVAIVSDHADRSGQEGGEGTVIGRRVG